MAIIKCPECGKEISDTVSQCIHCGYMIKKNMPTETNSISNNDGVVIRRERDMSQGRVLLILLIGFISISVIDGILGGCYSSLKSDAILVMMVTLSLILAIIFIGIAIILSQALNDNNSQPKELVYKTEDGYEAYDAKGNKYTFKNKSSLLLNGKILIYKGEKNINLGYIKSSDIPKISD